MQAVAARNATYRLGHLAEGIDLARDMDEAAFQRLHDAFCANGVMVFRNQKISPEEHIRFSRRFGELEIHVVTQYLLDGYPELLKISNLMKDGKRVGASAEYWHSDLTYMAKPSRCSLLYAIEISVDASGKVLGDTMFASTQLAYDAMSEAMKKKLAPLKGVHRFLDAYNRQNDQRASRGIERTAMQEKELRDKTPDVLHPVVRTHPFTGRKCIYVNEGFTVGIEGMSESDGKALIAELHAHCLRPEFAYRHQWQVGDLVLWDNCSTIHSGTSDYGPEHRRLLYRTTVKGGVPF
ncbi:MAG: TauD/TfdA family dioxygenase [Betaproteobacteria bacterium]|nr:TauD/TfdA family dioxygenase [Betaproteobacteria bacterium]